MTDARKRRRSSTVGTLVLAAGSLGVTACDGGGVDPAARIYSNLEACAAERPMAECQEIQQRAMADHLVTAPRYTTLAACEAEHGEGACATNQVTSSAGSGSGGSSFGDVFVPAMVGFMVANAIDDAFDGGRRRYARPLYADRSGYIYLGNQSISRFRGSCNPLARNCGSSGGGTVVGTGGSWAANTTVPRSSVQQAAPSASQRAVTRPRGGFGGTGARASGRGGG